MKYLPNYDVDDPTKNPKFNPLKRFRTYSYHHAILVTNTTELASILSSKQYENTDVYQHPDTLTSGEDRYTVKTLEVGGKKIPYIVLINTMTDSNLTIPTLNIKSFVGSILTPEHTNNGLNIPNTITFTVQEPFGSRFVEFLVKAYQQLNLPSASAIFILKTFFVGHKDDDSVEIIGSVKPYAFQIYDLVFSFSSSGTTYEVHGVPVYFGVPNISATSIVGGDSFEVVGSTLFDFVRAYNNKLQQQYNEFVAMLEQKNINKIVTKHVIELDRLYHEYELSGNILERNKTTPEKWIFTPSSNATIQENLYHVLSFCDKIQEESKPKPENFVDNIAKTYVPSIQTYVRQYDVEGRTIRENVYRIVRFENTVLKRQENEKNLIENTNNAYEKLLAEQLSQGNLIEFDYIFSGKNDDIINFNMEFNNFGMGLMYNVLATQQPSDLKTQIEENIVAQNSNSTMVSPSNSGPQGVFFSIPYSKSKPLRDIQGYEDFQQALRFYSLYQSFNTEIEILGNVRLLSQTQTDPEDFFIKRIPTFVKINVYMPRIDPSTGFVDFKSVPEKGFKNPFWYNGIFQIYQIDHTFSEGNFTQKMILFPVPSVENSIVQISDSQKNQKQSSTETVEAESRTANDAKTGANVKQKQTTAQKKSKCTKPLTEITGARKQVESNTSLSFYAALRILEGNSSYRAVNVNYHLGAYQMGEQALTEIRMIDPGKSNQKKGIYVWKTSLPEPILNQMLKKNPSFRWNATTQQFLDTPDLQDIAIIEYHKIVWKNQLKAAHNYVNKTIHNLLITPSGLIGAAHLVGSSSVLRFLESNGKIIPTDGNCVPLTTYLYLLGNKDVSVIVGNDPKYKPNPSLKLQKANLNQPGLSFYVAGMFKQQGYYYKT